MFERLKSKTAVALIASLIAALGVGGIALAQNSGTSAGTHAAQARDAETNDGPGDAETNDGPGDAAEANDQPGDDGGKEQADDAAQHGQQHEAEDSGPDQGEE